SHPKDERNRVGHCQASNQAKTPCQKRGVFAMCARQKRLRKGLLSRSFCVWCAGKEEKKAALTGGLFAFMLLGCGVVRAGYGNRIWQIVQLVFRRLAHVGSRRNTPKGPLLV
ncbi:hypothetical protein B4900_20405, partial [Yersinia rohdei]